MDGPGSLVLDAPSVSADRVLLIDFFCDVLHPRLYDLTDASFMWPLMNMMCLASYPTSFMVCMAVARKQWAVYR